MIDQQLEISVKLMYVVPAGCTANRGACVPRSFSKHRWKSSPLVVSRLSMQHSCGGSAHWSVKPRNPLSVESALVSVYWWRHHIDAAK